MSSEEEPAAWLRAQIEAREAVAKAVKDGSYPWDGQWEARDRHALETYNGWVIALAPGIRDSRDPRSVAAAEFPPGVVEHIAANDPQDTIARCEAELAILDEHYILTRDDRNPDYEEFSVVPWGAKGGAGDRGSGCVTCHYYGMGGVKGYGICRTVRLLASAYKHRPGYREEDWKP